MALAALVLALLAATSSAAAADATTPTEALEELFARANEVLTDPETADRPLDRLLAVRKLVNEAFDFRSAAELASGDHWRARTAAEQEEFTWLFADLLERAFVSRMAARASLEHGTRIRYLDESVDGGRALVKTAIARRDGGEMRLDYDLVERDGTWKVRDVAIDGVSLMANYRAQLDRVLGAASFPELLTQMRAKVGAVDSASPTAAAPSEEDSPTIQTIAIVDLPLPEPEVELATYAPPAGEPTALATVVPEPVPPAAAPKPHTLTTKAYWLRISTTTNGDEAGRLVSRLRDGKHSVGVVRTTVGGTLSVSVRVGPFQDAQDAVLELLALQTKGHDPYLIAERE